MERTIVLQVSDLKPSYDKFAGELTIEVPTQEMPNLFTEDGIDFINGQMGERLAAYLVEGFADEIADKIISAFLAKRVRR